jgi:hypothetical protein
MAPVAHLEPAGARRRQRGHEVGPRVPGHGRPEAGELVGRELGHPRRGEQAADRELHVEAGPVRPRVDRPDERLERGRVGPEAEIRVRSVHPPGPVAGPERFEQGEERRPDVALVPLAVGGPERAGVVGVEIGEVRDRRRR